MKRNVEHARIVVFLFLGYAFLVLLITQYQRGMLYLPDLSGSRIKVNFEPFLKFNEALTTIRTNGLPGGAEDSGRQVLKYIAIVAFGFFANVLMFVPLGIFLPLMSKKTDGFLKVTLVGFVASLMIEISQLGVMLLFFASKRVFDIDDLIANTLGAATGYIIYVFFQVILIPIKKLARA